MARFFCKGAETSGTLSFVGGAAGGVGWWGAYKGWETRYRNGWRPKEERDIVSADQGGSIGTFSPHTGSGLKHEDVIEESEGSDHAEALLFAEEVDEALGLEEAMQSTVFGDWATGAENSVMSTYPPGTDPRAVEYSMAWKGLRFNQLTALHFSAQEGGPQKVYIADVEDFSLPEVRSMLGESNVPFRSVAGRDGSIRVTIFQDNGRKEHSIDKFAQKANVTVTRYDGKGKFIGDWGKRSKAAAEYRRIIKEYETEFPDSARYEGRLREGLLDGSHPVWESPRSE